MNNSERSNEENEELLKILAEPRSYIRTKIRSQVNDCLWLTNLKLAQSNLTEKLKVLAIAKGPLELCSICTLPIDLCDHVDSWLEKKKEFHEVMKDDIEKDLDDILDLVKNGVTIETKNDLDNIDIKELCWKNLDYRLSDRIGDKAVAISLPSERGWHSCVLMRQKFLVVFGGLRYRKIEVPQPFTMITKQEDIEYLSDICIFDIEGISWHHLTMATNMTNPEGRYGHVAVALDDDRMLMFGGRGSKGKLLSDTWIFSFSNSSWTLVDNHVDFPHPSPRVFSAAIADNCDVYLFGGTDGVNNFCDLWIFHGAVPTAKQRHQPYYENMYSMKWERQLAVGPVPSPRYGHQMVLLPHLPSLRPSNPSAAVIAVLGGCCVSPMSETAGESASAAGLSLLGETLEGRYRAEALAPMASGQLLRSLTAPGGMPMSLVSEMEQSHLQEPASSLRGLYKLAAEGAARQQTLEADSRRAELQMLSAWRSAEAEEMTRQRRSRHPFAGLDITFLEAAQDSLQWRTQHYPSIRGEVPSCRMHFGCFSIGRFLFVIGGARPTSLGHSPVDGEAAVIHSLDLVTMRWQQQRPIGGEEWLDQQLSAAEAAVTRATRRCEDERCRAMSLGATAGSFTSEQRAAKAEQDVCLWQRERLRRELSSAASTPPAVMLWTGVNSSRSMTPLPVSTAVGNDASADGPEGAAAGRLGRNSCRAQRDACHAGYGDAARAAATTGGRVSGEDVERTRGVCL